MKKIIVILWFVLIGFSSYCQDFYSSYSFGIPTLEYDFFTWYHVSGGDCSQVVGSGAKDVNGKGSIITDYGLCWSKYTSNPTINDNKYSYGSLIKNETTFSGVPYSGACMFTAGTWYFRFYAINCDGVGYSGVFQGYTEGSTTTVPTVSTTSVSEIGTYAAYSGGSTGSDGGSSITAKGVVWGYDPSISISNYVGITNDGSGTSSYSSYLSGLSEGTNYYVMAYATNSIGTGYGNAIQFTTQRSVTVPNVTTASINSITSSSAYSGGTVNYSGGGSIIERGVCWNTTGSPNTIDSKTSNGTGTGSFSSFIENLTPNTIYYVRAYAKACGMVNGLNVCATGYGDELSFTTLPSGSCDLPTVTTNAVNSITTNSASGGGNVTSDGGCDVTANGVCWSTSTNPTTANSHTTDGSGIGAFSSSITGLTCGNTYYVRAYAINNSGTAYGNQVSFIPTSANLPLLALKDYLTTSTCGSGNFYFSFNEACVALNKYNNDGYSCGTTSLSGAIVRTSGTVGSYIYIDQSESCVVLTVYAGYFLAINPSSGNYEVYHITDGIIQSITPCP